MMTVFLAAATNESAGVGAILEKYLPYQGMGLLVVLITLSVLSGICAFIGALFGARTRRQAEAKAAAATSAAAPAAAPAALSPPAPVEEEVTDPRTVAAIAAAIAVTLARPYRIIEIQAAGHPVGMTSAWAIEGRFQHFSSHKVR